MWEEEFPRTGKVSLAFAISLLLSYGCALHVKDHVVLSMGALTLNNKAYFFPSNFSQVIYFYVLKIKMILLKRTIMHLECFGKLLKFYRKM